MITIDRASAGVTYNSYSLIGDTVTITGPSPLSSANSETGGAGQVTLHLTNGQAILAWCLDIWDQLQHSGTYSVTPNGAIYAGQHATSPISTTKDQQIGGLMVEGNKLITNNQTLTFTNSTKHDSYTFTAADESAATQILIWSTIYGSAFTYFLPNKSTAFDDNFSALLAYITANSGTSSYATLDPDPANCYTYGCPTPNQHLGYAVPSPLAGAGLPGLLAACGVLSLLARRRRRAIA